MECIRTRYQVPAYRHRRVRVEGGAEGVITGTSGHHLLIRLDGEGRSRPYHPTWRITYLDVQP